MHNQKEIEIFWTKYLLVFVSFATIILPSQEKRQKLMCFHWCTISEVLVEVGCISGHKSRQRRVRLDFDHGVSLVELGVVHTNDITT